MAVLLARRLRSRSTPSGRSRLPPASGARDTGGLLARLSPALRPDGTAAPARWLPAALGVAALLAVYASWQLLRWGPAGDRQLIGDAFFYPVSGAAALTAWGASRRCAAWRRLQLAWRLLALAALVYLLGDVAQTGYELAGAKPYPSVADGLYLVFYPLMLAGVLSFPTARRGRGEHVRLGLDMAVVALGGSAVVVYVVLGPTAVAGGSLLQGAFSVAYPVGDMVLLVGLASLLLRGTAPSARRALTFLALGAAFYIAADLTYGYITLHSSYQGGDAVDTLWMLAIAVTAVAGAAQHDVAGPEQPSAARAQVAWVPYLAVAAGFATLLFSDRHDPVFPGLTMTLTALLLAGLVSVRQFLAQRDLARAARERERMEIDLRTAHRLEAVGELAAGIAHEINTPVQFVGDSVTFLQHSFRDLRQLVTDYRTILADLAANRCDESTARARIAEAEERADLPYLEKRTPAALDRSREGLHRVSAIVGAMKEFARPRQAEHRPVDLNEAIRSTLVISTSSYKGVADVECELGELPDVLCDAGEINQVLLNLIVNAAQAIGDALPEGPDERGKITIESARDRDWALVRISDTGPGIPAEIHDRIFDPFFSTKQPGRSTGQGLAISHSIVVDKHHGTLTFESAPGVGTSFEIRLPCH